MSWRLLVEGRIANISPIKKSGGVLAFGYTIDNTGVDRGRSWAVTHETYKSAKMKGKKEQKKSQKKPKGTKIPNRQDQIADPNRWVQLKRAK